MKLKELTLLFVLALGTQVAFAQQSKSDPTVEFNPHWYGQIQGGVAHTVGETVFKDLLSPAGALSLGYQFNPTLGLRVGASGWQAKGNSIPIEVYKFNFLQGNVDLTFHLANLFGYNHKRVLDPYALIGGGVAIGFNNGANNVKAVKQFMGALLIFRCAVMDHHDQLYVLKSKGLCSYGINSLFKDIQLHIMEGNHH